MKNNLDALHTPVMINEVIEVLNLKENVIYVDATFGNGGYTKKILDTEKCNVIAFDRDNTVKNTAKKFKKEYGKRFKFINDKFSNIDKYISEKSIDGIVFDIGVSSMQIDTPERGFSYMKDGKLDMRMGKSELSAKEIINNFKKEVISDIIFKYGEERNARKIARAVEKARSEKEIKTTLELKEIISNAVPKKFAMDAVKKTFQAIRIFVNEELKEIEEALLKVKDLLKKEGIVAVVTFHSLEDRIVKNFLKENTVIEKVNKYKEEKKNGFFKKIGLLKVTKEESLKNKRAHSAKLRYGIKS